MLNAAHTLLFHAPPFHSGPAEVHAELTLLQRERDRLLMLQKLEQAVKRARDKATLDKHNAVRVCGFVLSCFLRCDANGACLQSAGHFVARPRCPPLLTAIVIAALLRGLRAGPRTFGLTKLNVKLPL